MIQLVTVDAPVISVDVPLVGHGSSVAMTAILSRAFALLFKI